MKELVVVIFSCILLLGRSFINADTDPTDASVLMSMYSSLNSPSQLSQWSSTGGDPCQGSWKGIKCSGSRVTEIDISGLGLSGSLGFQLDKLSALTKFDVSNNNIGNQLPYQLPQNVQQLNLAANGFNGGLPYSISQMASLKYLNVSHNQFQGDVNDMFGSLTSLSTLDFSFNTLSGDLPKSFSLLTDMNNMYLENNQFTGTIDVLAGLPLDNLNVENNRFNGWIPDQLKGINLRTGGNSWSSGPAPPPPPPPPGTPPVRPGGNPSSGGNSKSHDDGSGGGSKKSGIGGGGIAGIIISILVVGAIVAFFVVKRRSRRSSTDVEKLDNQPFVPFGAQEVQEVKSIQTSATATKAFELPASVSLKPPPIDRLKSFDEDDVTVKPILTPKKTNRPPVNTYQYSVADLQIATNSFSVDNLIGEGSIGRVYRAEFNDGKVLAVKKIKSSALPNPEEFIDIVAEISLLHHPNVTELEGYCSEHGQHLLVYEFHKNGSLHEYLHLSDEYSRPLIWNTRVKIALGTARALEYLHETCSPSVVHRNFKSANILLDTELNPHLSDCGLANLVHEADEELSHNAAPEVSMSGQYTIKSDVYSFGVVMLELLTGRQPFDSSRLRSEQSLVRWATPQLHDIDALSKMVDPALKGLYPVKSLSRFADVIALCVQPEPEFRPPMSEVVEALVRLVQRANMSKRTVGNESFKANSGDDRDL